MLKVIKDLTPAEIASITDHTYLNRVEAFLGKADHPIKARREEFYNFLSGISDLSSKPYAVCIPYGDVAYAKEYLDGSGIKIASVVGFPDGDTPTCIKKIETLAALRAGADEIDFVMNYERLREMNVKYVVEEMEKIAQLAHNHGALVKMILETSELHDSQIQLACGFADVGKIDFVKTSTGFSSSGAHPHDLKIMRENFSRGVKMSGKVRPNNVYDLLEAASGRNDGIIDLDPMKIRIGANPSLLGNLK
ncbi:MAG: deoxyribose-phosphate aldolase [Nanoarchaeota archaeon]|nr:deoxyribose-phosphate aldolase [Nanoarchaeota archaeon]